MMVDAIGCCLRPILEALIDAFPFVVLGFRSNNGSECINKRVAALLENLRIQEFTKSRARRTNNNALVESKNGSVVRKYLGYAPTSTNFADLFNAFTQSVLSPYLDLHRAWFFPTEELDPSGRIRKRDCYNRMMTPCDKLRSSPDARLYPRPGVTLVQLDGDAFALSDDEAARRLNQARAELFQNTKKTQEPAA